MRNEADKGVPTRRAPATGQIPICVNPTAPTFIEMLNMTDDPLTTLPESVIRPGRQVLEQVMEELR